MRADDSPNRPNAPEDVPTPSSLNGERAGVRGGPNPRRQPRSAPHFSRLLERQRAWLLLVLLLVLTGCSQRSNELIVYTSQDQHFAEPLFAEFTRQSGIQVRAVYDSEAVKTVGLANRLIAESKHPQADVWWSNEALRTWQLAARGVLDTNTLVQFGFRSRRIVINTNLLAPVEAPKSLLEITNARWCGRVALAYPMFGTTSAQFMALRQHWGTERWEQWCRALVANKPFVVDGNSVVVKLVGRGEAVVGLTDFDDVVVGQREKLPIAMLPHDELTVAIPNTAAVVRGSERTAQAGQLIQFLTSQAALARMVESAALEGTTGPASALPVSWPNLVQELEPTSRALQQIFLK
jgi:iron(III) transport system substrate-binding protein